jgi:hypothetical protein
MIKKFIASICLGLALNAQAQTTVEGTMKVLCAPTDVISSQLGVFSSLTSFNDAQGNTWFIVKRDKSILIMFSPTNRPEITCIVTFGNTGVNTLL